jgi:hypothetical protein
MAAKVGFFEAVKIAIGAAIKEPNLTIFDVQA